MVNAIRTNKEIAVIKNKKTRGNSIYFQMELCIVFPKLMYLLY